MDLRQCQTLAIQTVKQRREEDERETNLSLCTGAGKSIIIREITKDTERIILVFPWLDLLTQYYDDHKQHYSSCGCVRYLATEGTLSDVQRLSTQMSELTQKHYVIFTTYTSAPLLYNKLGGQTSVDLLVHDEAHRVERAEYKAALTRIADLVKHTANLSATLPDSKSPHYKYPLLRGIKDGVVRDFHMELFLCVAKEKNETTLLLTIVRKLLSLHKQVKLLVYTAEANTDGETSSSVKTFMDRHSIELTSHGWWIQGINEETKDRKKLLREFEKSRDVSILVSCKTLSEGIDLKGANCMLPWDPSASVKDNVQRIGRVLRLYKTKEGAVKKEQPASTVLIPVFLQEQKYLECGGDKEKINALLCKEISEGERGNFRPIVSVCTALKEELAEDDEELFNRLLNYPYEPKVSVDRNLVECVAKECKKSVDTVLEDIVGALEGKVDDEQLELIKEGEWDDEILGDVAQALADTQKLTLVVRDGEEADIFGSGETQLAVEKKESGEGYKVVRGKRAASDKDEAKKRIAQRLRVEISDGCKVLLGLDSIADADTTGNMVLSRLTTEVQYDDDWEKRRLEWVSFVRDTGSYPKSRSSDRKERSIYGWQNWQRAAYRDRRNHPWMTEERVAKLSDPLETPGWLWEVDTWEENRQLWLKLKSEGKNPNADSSDPDIKRAGRWQGDMREAYALNRVGVLTEERKRILEDPLQTPGWKWKDDRWEDALNRWINWFAQNGGKYPSHGSNNPEERCVGQWQKNQRKLRESSNTAETQRKVKILDETPGWKWSPDGTPKTPYTPPESPSNTATNPLTPSPRTRKPIKPPVEDAAKSSNVRKLSKLETYHQRFKTMNAATYKDSVKPEEFEDYHTLADTYDARDPPECQPINKIAGLLSKFNKPSYRAIDLGCGKNRLRSHTSVSKMSWTSVDVHAVDETVTVADIAALPYEEESFDIAVLSRSLWARNHLDVLREAYRVLKWDGRAVICESFRRWMKLEGESPHNTLVTDLKAVGFEIAFEEGTKGTDETADVFQYIVIRKS
jgi:superfamily II DNA or RNA helicase